MHQKQGFQSEHKRTCGPMGRGKFGGPWGRGTFNGFRDRFAGGVTNTPVNIEETSDTYVISLFAAGLAKEKVTLTVKDDVLTIAYPGADQGADSESTQGSFTYREYNQGAFERTFWLNDKVSTEHISASYTDGILKVTLPKNPATNIPAQTISVA